jgi:hypothetical protein
MKVEVNPVGIVATAQQAAACMGKFGDGHGRIVDSA